MDSPKIKNLNILSFNWHEPYLCLLSKTSHFFKIIEPDVREGVIRKWSREMRPLPQNVSLINKEFALSQLDSGDFDFAICHNLKDLIFIKDFLLPKIMVFHNKLSTEIALGNNKIDREKYLLSLKQILNNVTLVFISEAKQNDWGLDGTIITPGIDMADYEGYSGSMAKVLRVGNMMRERDLMMGYSMQEKIIKDIPNTLLGQNPTVPEAQLSKNWADLKNYYKTYRMLLNTTLNPYEDGYNLAMLEAMATGMPVISFYNPTSPIVDGENGFISDDIPYLIEKTKFLLSNREAAKLVGEKGHQTVKEKFSLNEFTAKWETAITNTAKEFVSFTQTTSKEQIGKLEIKKRDRKNKAPNILMNYVSNPITTAAYFEKSFRKKNNVITCGPKITDEDIQGWDLGQIKKRVKAQDIPCAHDVDIKALVSSMSQDQYPDFYLWIDTGINTIPKNLDLLDIPKACYLIDAHIGLNRHLPIASHFDFVFVAQKEYVPCFKKAGCRRVFWLPLACDPGIHKNIKMEKLYDVGFVGSITPAHIRRKRLLDALSEKYRVHIERCFLEDMAGVFCQSKIVFNDAIKNNLNMRVFEALSTGSCLFTDEASGSGLTDLFKDKEHLVIYNEENLLELAEFYLTHQKAREQIAQKGHQEVLSKHTYDHRAEEMVTTIFKELKEENVLSLDKNSSLEKPETYYSNVREDVIAMIPPRTKKLLDIGCSSGLTGKRIKKLGVPFVAGIEKNEWAATEAKKYLDQVNIGDIETIPIPYPKKHFDCILFADVLEHLVNPAQVIKKITPYLDDDGVIIASIPNVKFFGVIHNLVEGNWTYEKEGILDETHLRFFTLKEIKKLFHQTGLEILEIGTTIDPQYKNLQGQKNGQLKFGRILIQNLSEEECRDFFVYQYKILAKKNTRKELHEILDYVSQLDDTKTEESLKILKNADSYFKRAIERDPTNSKAIYGEGLCSWKMGEKETGFQKYCKALNANIENIDAITALAKAADELGSFDLAEKYLLEYVSLHPANLNILFRLSGIQFKLEKMEEAKENLDKIFIFDPNHYEATQLMKKIEDRSHKSL